MLAPTHHSKVCCGTKSPTPYRSNANAVGGGTGVGTTVGTGVGTAVTTGVAVGEGVARVVGVARSVGTADAAGAAGAAADATAVIWPPPTGWQAASSAARTTRWRARRVICGPIIGVGGGA